jgi:alkylation response protein AidB-like acyl-CoA dehydrogenase
MGVRGTGTAEVKLHGGEVGDEAIVGGLNGGFKVVLDDLNNGRTCVGAIGLGIAQVAIKEAEVYARGKTAFGTAIINFRVLQHYVASIKAQIEAVRGVVYTAAYYRDKKRRVFPALRPDSQVPGVTARRRCNAHSYADNGGLRLLHRLQG